MYRYSVDNAVTYTSEDFVLFRESPFACWMERLTLENPDHGIPPDIGSAPPRSRIERQDELADTLRGEGKDVAHISWDMDEPERRAATLAAMRNGTDYIVDGHLALGPLAAPANLLVRTSGYSELGDYLYTPCDTQARSGQHSAFRLCFLADLLHSLQGQLPPQMLIIRDGDDLVPLQTEDHIYHYRAVKQRFMEAMRSFRKHRMPDPAESSHFGRWSDCAHEVLKQRMLRQEGALQVDASDPEADEELVQPLPRAVAAGDGGSYGLPGDPELTHEPNAQASAAPESAGGYTLAEQAKRLAPGSYKPGPGYFRLRQLGGASSRQSHAPEHLSPVGGATPAKTGEAAVPPASSPGPAPRYNRRASDKALQNLEFIGSSQQAPDIGADKPADTSLDSTAGTAPSPSLRDPNLRMAPIGAGQPMYAAQGATTVTRASFGDLAWEQPEAKPGPEQDRPHPTQNRPPSAERSVIDLDSSDGLSPPPEFTTSDSLYGEDEPEAPQQPQPRPFSDSIFNDPLFTDPLFTDSDRPDRATDNGEHRRTGSPTAGGLRERGQGISETLITSDDFDE